MQDRWALRQRMVAATPVRRAAAGDTLSNLGVGLVHSVHSATRGNKTYANLNQISLTKFRITLCYVMPAGARQMATKNQNRTESRSARRARLLREGNSWRQSCLMSGYSKSAANRGPRAYFRQNPNVRREFVRLAEDDPYSPAVARKIVKNRLIESVLEGKPSNISREIELLGKFREHDWWVHGPDVQVGIFQELASHEGGQMLAAMVKKADEYKD